MDRTSKLLLAVCAIALLLNTASHSVTPAHAHYDWETSVRDSLIHIDEELGEIARYLRSIENGTCQNRKLCQ